MFKLSRIRVGLVSCRSTLDASVAQNGSENHNFTIATGTMAGLDHPPRIAPDQVQS
ncbi:hypothetical protein BH11MYX1_BH11MYX1_04570 [soil metagenome]